MIDAYAMLVASVEDGIRSTIEQKGTWFRADRPMSLSIQDEDAVTLYGELLRHHRHDLVAVSANISNLLIWLPLLSAQPMLKQAEMNLFGEYDTNLSVTEFMHFADSKLDKDFTGVELYQLTMAIAWWNATITRWVQGEYFARLTLGEDEEE